MTCHFAAGLYAEASATSFQEHVSDMELSELRRLGNRALKPEGTPLRLEAAFRIACFSAFTGLDRFIPWELKGKGSSTPVSRNELKEILPKVLKNLALQKTELELLDPDWRRTGSERIMHQITHASLHMSILEALCSRADGPLTPKELEGCGRDFFGLFASLMGAGSRTLRAVTTILQTRLPQEIEEERYGG